MNYRHAYHAGNFADIFKHLILCMAVAYLQNKDKGLFILDAFAGCGLYDIQAPEATRTNEYKNGVEAFMNIAFTNADLQQFQERLKSFWHKGQYPGSPLLIAEKLRPQDRLFANELHPDDLQKLRDTLSFFSNVKTLHKDAYESIKAFIPPEERRGLILIDPPFERKDEFETIARQMEEWMKRWPTGCYMIWYPIKTNSSSHVMFDAALELNAQKVWVAEFLLYPKSTPDSFNGCGIMIINTPFGLPEQIEAAAQPLCAALQGIEITSQWLK